jgi:hypothetical protein
LARIARFFHFDPRGMSDSNIRIWTEAIKVIKAEEALENDYDRLTPDGIYKAILITTGDKVKADYERSKQILKQSKPK